jgi:hypothetical protein
MMANRAVRCTAAFGAGALANFFILYRFLTYVERNHLPTSTFWLFAGVCFLIGFAVTFGTVSRPFRLANWVPFGVIVAQMAVIGFDWQKDPTDHNMLPFELIFFWVLASPAYLGAVASRRLATAKR